ncbi:MAG: uridine kinase [Phycisphaerales bacterium]
MTSTDSIANLASMVHRARLDHGVHAATPLANGAARPPRRAMVVFMSGIDASGKGTTAAALTAGLEALGHTVAAIGIDPWLNPPAQREQPTGTPDRGPHFYENAFDFERLFDALIDPLARDGKIDLRVRLGGQSGQLTDHRYHFEGVDIIVVEGVFLLKRALLARADVRIWVRCLFETALERAIARNQEGLEAESIKREYQEMYFAAQRHHFLLDRPYDVADVIFEND